MACTKCAAVTRERSVVVGRERLWFVSELFGSARLSGLELPIIPLEIGFFSKCLLPSLEPNPCSAASDGASKFPGDFGVM